MKGTPVIKTFICALTIAVLTSGIASADEVYSARLQDGSENMPDIVYEFDNGDQAVWVAADGNSRFYIDGLGGVFENRQSYKGRYVFYSGEGPGCDSGVFADHLGNQVPYWGHLSIQWSNDSNFVMQIGECDGKADEGMTIIGQNK